MNKELFLKTLRSRLSFLSPSEIDERLAFYEEMIDDRMEEGMSEEEAVKAVGSVDKIAEQIMSETPLVKFVAKKVKPKRTPAAWEIILLIIGAPLWIPLLIAGVSVLFSIYISIWCILITVFAVNITFAVGAIVSIPCAIWFFWTGKTLEALFLLGGGMVLIGLTILMFYINIGISKGIVALSEKLVLWVKSWFVGKDKSDTEGNSHENS